METESPEGYYPRMIGMAPQVTRGPSNGWFELLVTGRDEIGGLAKLAAILAQHGINLSPSGGYYLLTPDTFVWTTFAIFARSKSSLERVLEELRHLDFVSKAEAVEAKNPIVDRFLFPVVIHGNRRGIIMDLQSLTEVEQRLIAIFGSAGGVLMFEEGEAYSTDNMKRLPGITRESAPDEVLDVVAAWLRAMGWGIFTFDSTRFDDEGAVGVTIGEPPNVLNGGKENHFLNGVVAGLVEFIFKRKVGLTLSRYDEPSRTLQLELRVQR